VIRQIRARIERLAPTGEGIAHDAGKVVFVDSALPGELVEAEVFEEKARHARAAATAVLEASPGRRETDGHAEACGGTDWAHFQLEPARAAKRDLFLETMLRIGRVEPELFGELPIARSGLEYRIRNQFHVARAAGEVRAGFFAKRSHRVVPLDGCEIVSAQTRAAIARLCSAGSLPDGRIEALEAVETGPGHALALSDHDGRPIAGSTAAVDVRVGSRPFRVSVGSFFQVNRHRIEALFDGVRDAVAASGARTALDAYAGAGFLSRALVEAGARVTAVEASPASSGDAQVNRSRLGSDDRLDLVAARVENFLSGSHPLFDVVVADPPREGLKAAAAPLAALARRQLIYVSCEPASLARDLGTILARGFRIESARLEDFFPLTHRVEAVVVLRRA
jgi:23S rRNA (uracil1939-C5)-methyltransferase